MGTNCAPLVADLFLFCYESDSMISLSDNNQIDVVEAFNSTSRYLVERLFLAVPRGCLQFVIVVFPDHTHLLFQMTCLILIILILNKW